MQSSCHSDIITIKVIGYCYYILYIEIQTVKSIPKKIDNIRYVHRFTKLYNLQRLQSKNTLDY